MFRSAVYHENSLVGEADVTPKDPNIGAWVREIRVSHFSPPSDRCPPLAVLHTIAPGGPRLKMEARLPSPGGGEPPPLIFSLYAACLQENKTAVVLLGQEELHLVAMTSQENPIQYSCFWGFTVVPGLYDSCVVMLNLRCLGIVFDLDETLIVANTMRSFEDKIDGIQRKINNEADPQRINAMLAEIKRYQDDKSILKQYIENDQIVENGKVFEVKSEVIPPLSGNHQLITRPIIRLQEKNIILTRINPAIRDTSVLVRLRPAWEELRSYLTARGRKRFEVYVCTMAERDYALEMWRLLDPEANLINSRELLNRIVCVKSGSRKSLLGVFQDGICHPKMALVIDDRLKVWEEQDQPRVHVVPPFAPYYSPQSEANSSVPVLCVARNVACNVRGGFFKQFDEGLLPRLTDVCYEDDMVNFPPSPDVANYLITEVQDDTVLNATKEPLGHEGMVDLEVERRLKDSNCGIQTIPLMANNINYGPISSLQHPIPSSGALSMTATQLVMPLSNNQGSQPIASSKALGQSGPLEPTLQGSPATEEGEVPESELDPDTRRRLLILQHGQDTRDPPLPLPPPPPPPFSVRPSPLQVSVPPVQPRGSWFPLEEEINPMHLKRTSKKFPLEPESMRFDSNRPQHHSFFRSAENFIPSNNVLHENQRLPVQVQHGDDRLRPSSDYHSFPGEKIPMAWGPSNYKDMNIECSRATAPYVKPPAAALYDISTKLGAKVEFRSKLCDTIELRFSIEAWLLGEKIGEGIGRTRREAQHLASERAIRNLANKYLSRALRDPTLLEDMNKFPHTKENGFASDPNDFGYPSYTRDEPLPLTSTSDEGHFLDNKPEGSRKAAASVAALKELCLMEGYNLSFNVQSPPSMGSIGKEEVHAQVEIGGQIFGKGTGATWEEAKLRAAEEALVSLKPMVSQKRQDSPRSSPAAPSKRLKQDLSRLLQRQPSSSRYSNNETHVP